MNSNIYVYRYTYTYTSNALVLDNLNVDFIIFYFMDLLLSSC